MMREHKFRAWDLVLGKMFYFSLRDPMDIAKTHKNEQGIFVDRYVVTQYTGLKDKNGKEIYEGDIVSNQYANIYTPIFRNGIYMAYNVEYLHLTEQEPSTQFNIVWKSGCEVIGNIYENPELIEDAR